jgi:hypothetical protein
VTKAVGFRRNHVRHLYPRPPFKRREQPWSGLAGIASAFPFPAIFATRHFAGSSSRAPWKVLGGLGIVVSNAGRRQSHA